MHLIKLMEEVRESRDRQATLEYKVKRTRRNTELLAIN